MQQFSNIQHTFDPVFDNQSEILILGTFPSVKSRENNFYYGHPQNRFWKVVSTVTGESVPQTIEEKKNLLLRNHIAVWDVIKSCTITGSSDSSIKDVVANDISSLLDQSQIRYIFGNGAKACQLYNRFVLSQTSVEIRKLPSTSPANASCKIDELSGIWKTEIVPCLQS